MKMKNAKFEVQYNRVRYRLLYISPCMTHVIMIYYRTCIHVKYTVPCSAGEYSYVNPGNADLIRQSIINSIRLHASELNIILLSLNWSKLKTLIMFLKLLFFRQIASACPILDLCTYMTSFYVNTSKWFTYKANHNFEILENPSRKKNLYILIKSG